MSFIDNFKKEFGIKAKVNYQVPPGMGLQPANASMQKPPTHTIAGFRSLFNFFINNTVFDPDWALRKNPRIYEAMLRDSHIYSALRSRAQLTAGLPWRIQSNIFDPDQERQQVAVDFLTRAISRIKNFPEKHANVLDATLKSMSVGELVWGFSEDMKAWIIEDIEPRNKDQFTYTMDGTLRLLNPNAPTFGSIMVDEEGRENSRDRFVVYIYDKSPGSWVAQEEYGYVYYGRGLGGPLYWIFFFKTTAFPMWMKWVDRYSIPMRKGTYPANNEQLRNEIINLLDQMKSDVNIAYPKDTDDLLTLEFISADQGKFDVFVSLMDFMNKEASKVVMGETLTLEQGKVGSLALGQIHESMLLSKVDFDSRGVAEAYDDSLIRLLIKFNQHKFPGIGPYLPNFQFIVDRQIEREARVQEIKDAIELGLPVPVAHARRVLNITEPQKDKEGNVEPILEPPKEEFSMRGFDNQTLMKQEKYLLDSLTKGEM